MGSHTHLWLVLRAEVAATHSTNPTLQTSWVGAKQETEMVLFTSIRKILNKLDISTQEVCTPDKHQSHYTVLHAAYEAQHSCCMPLEALQLEHCWA